MLKEIPGIFIRLIYPARCVVCKKNLTPKRINKFICMDCFNSIKKNVPPFCRSCGRHIDDISHPLCRNCTGRIYYFDRAFSACLYEGVMKELIHQFKYNGRDFLKQLLGRLLIEFINTYKLTLKEFDFVIGIPMHPSKLRYREYNQSLLLAEEIARNFNLVLLKEALYKIKDTLSQTQLDAQERINNVVGSFRINPKFNLRDKNILIVDDLLTTGATASEAARIIKSAGARKVWVLALAS